MNETFQVSKTWEVFGVQTLRGKLAAMMRSTRSSA